MKNADTSSVAMINLTMHLCGEFSSGEKIYTSTEKGSNDAGLSLRAMQVACKSMEVHLFESGCAGRGCFVSNHYSIVYYAFEFVFKSRDYHLKTQEKLSLY